MDEHDKPFLTRADRAYLDMLFLALEKTDGISPDRAAAAMREVATGLHRHRMRGDIAPAERVYAYGGVAAHAEMIAALLVVPPRRRWRGAMALLALLAAAAGILGVRVIFGVVFRRIEPVGIDGFQLVLVGLIAGVVYLLTMWDSANTRLQRGGWFGVALPLGALSGIALVRVLRPLHLDHILIALPFWVAAMLVVVFVALLWLFTLPDDRDVFSPIE